MKKSKKAASLILIGQTESEFKNGNRSRPQLRNIVLQMELLLIADAMTAAAFSVIVTEIMAIMALLAM